MAIHETREQAIEANLAFFEQATSSDPVQVQKAAEAGTNFTRRKLRETSWFEKVLPPEPISNKDLDRQMFTDKPVKLVDFEPNSPAAISVPFNTTPLSFVLRGQRYPVMQDRILSPRMTKDVDELRTWEMDIRQVVSDNIIKDMLTEIDSRAMTSVDATLGGAADVVLVNSGVAQWQSFAGSITREGIAEMMKIMPRGGTDTGLEAKVCVINNITIKEFMKFAREEAGGDLAQDLLTQGVVFQEFAGAKWIVTIKESLVPTGDILMFGAPEALGKHYVLVDTTMYIKSEAFSVSFFAYTTRGATIGNTLSVARASFDGVS